MVQPIADPGCNIVDATAADGRTWFGHPRQLARLFSTEMWERFGYYGMRALLVLFLTDHFLLSDEKASGLYGAFTSLVFLTPMLGGLLADHYLGAKRSVKLGAILMAMGYLGLCFNGPTAKPYFEYGGQRYAVAVTKQGNVTSQYVVANGRYLQIKGNEDGSIELVGSDGHALPRMVAKGEYQTGGERAPFFLALTLLSLSAVAIGNGFFKPNISAIVGRLYAPNDRRRDGGFTIFYMGINLGSLISQFFCPLLAAWFGWWAGFGLAAIGMVVAWALFQFDGGRLAGYGEPPEESSVRDRCVITVGAVLAIPVAWLLLTNVMNNADAVVNAHRSGAGVFGYLASLPVQGKVLFSVFLLAVVGIPIWAYRVGTHQEFQRMTVAIILTVFSVAFWTLFDQAGSSMTLFADRNTDRQIGGYLMPAGQTQIFNPLFIVAFAPLLGVLWVGLARKGLEPSTPIKFATGLILAGAGFLTLVLGTQFAGADFRVPLAWLVLTYLLHSLGELCISPVGLSMVTKLSIPRVVGLMMGVWFLSSSMAQYVGGIVAQTASVATVGGKVTNPKLALATYVGVFQMIGFWSIAMGVLLLLLSKPLERGMHSLK